MQIMLAVLWVLALLAGWLATLFSLPGIWLMVVAAAGYAWLSDPDSTLAIGWPLVSAMFLLALTAELLESLAGAFGAARLGGSRRGMLMALAGSIVGGILGAGVGLPVPVIGPLLGAILCGAIGALVGAVSGESWKGRDLATSLEIGHAAFWGRLAGSAAKIAIATLLLVLGLGAICF